MLEIVGDTNYHEGKYTIGFTECQYMPNDENVSPTPSVEHAIGYTSMALDYAERTNRGENKHLQDHSVFLDKKKLQSVQKIKNSMLDLRYEESERRRSVSPQKCLSSMELRRSDSVLSQMSDLSVSSSSSGPLIEVQQLPPLGKQTPYSGTTYSGLSNSFRGRNKFDTNQRRQFFSRDRKSDVKIAPEAKHLTLHVAPSKSYKQTNKHSNNDVKVPARKDEEAIKLVSGAGTKQGKSKKHVNFSTDASGIRASTELTNINLEFSGTPASANAPYKRYNRSILKNKKSQSRSSHRLTFCQSSYTERAERERLNNIRRRHASQIKIGPIDFSKLKRQVHFDRSFSSLS